MVCYVTVLVFKESIIRKVQYEWLIKHLEENKYDFLSQWKLICLLFKFKLQGKFFTSDFNVTPTSVTWREQYLFSSDATDELKEAISKKNHELVFLYDINLVDEIWGDSRPKPPMKPIRVHEIKYAGVDVSSKLSSLRSELFEAGCTAIVISMLDEVAWLLNLVTLQWDYLPSSKIVNGYLIIFFLVFISWIKFSVIMNANILEKGSNS